jgi:hypothetical protein
MELRTAGASPSTQAPNGVCFSVCQAQGWPVLPREIASQQNNFAKFGCPSGSVSGSLKFRTRQGARRPCVKDSSRTNIQIHAAIDAMTASKKAAERIFRSMRMQPPSLRMKGPYAIARVKSQGKDRHRNREQLDHVITPMVDGSLSRRRDESASGCGKNESTAWKVLGQPPRERPRGFSSITV